MCLVLSRTTAVREACTAALKDVVRVGQEGIYVCGQSSWDVHSLS